MAVGFGRVSANNKKQDVALEKYISAYWQVDLPVGWQADVEDDAVSLYHPDSNGTLTFSATQEQQAITDEYLEDLLIEHLDAGAELFDVEYEPFSGVTCCYDDDEEYWCEWYLRAGPVLLFITYNCPLDDEGAEEDVIESILESLSLPNKINLH